jgi:hypothetical protein
MVNLVTHDLRAKLKQLVLTSSCVDDRSPISHVIITLVPIGSCIYKSAGRRSPQCELIYYLIVKGQVLVLELEFENNVHTQDRHRRYYDCFDINRCLECSWQHLANSEVVGSIRALHIIK